MSIASAGREQKAREQRILKWDNRFMLLAQQVAGWSKDPGTRVGCVLVSRNVVISTGYNGLPRKLSDTNLQDRDSKLSRTVHAEMNAVLNAGATLQLAFVHGITAYITPLMVCDRCAVHLIQAGVTRVVMVKPPEPYRSPKTGEVEWNENASKKLAEWERLGNLSLRYFAEAGVVVTILDEISALAAIDGLEPNT